MTLEKNGKVEAPLGPKQPEHEWHALETKEVLDHLRVQGNGLTSEEAKRRLEQYGPNQLKEAPRPTFLQMLWEQLNNFVVILLIVASVISALLGDYVEAAAIMAIVVLNAVLGIVQERRAEEALAALKKLAAPDAQVIRDGRRISVPSYDLVPGDIVFLEAGNFIPADMRLLEAVNLRVEEASLTGESLPVQKNAATVLEKNVPLGRPQEYSLYGHSCLLWARTRCGHQHGHAHTAGSDRHHAAKCGNRRNTFATPARSAW